MQALVKTEVCPGCGATDLVEVDGGTACAGCRRNIGAPVAAVVGLKMEARVPFVGGLDKVRVARSDAADTRVSKETMQMLCDLVYAYMAVRGVPRFADEGVLPGGGCKVFVDTVYRYWEGGGTAFHVSPEFGDAGDDYSAVWKPGVNLDGVVRAVALCVGVLCQDPDIVPARGVAGATKRSAPSKCRLRGVASGVNLDAMVSAVVATLIGGDCPLTPELLCDVRVFLVVALGLPVSRRLPSHMQCDNRPPIISVVGVTNSVRGGLGDVSALTKVRMGGTLVVPEAVALAQCEEEAAAAERYGVPRGYAEEHPGVFLDRRAQGKYMQICKLYFDDMAQSQRTGVISGVDMVCLQLPHTPMVFIVNPALVVSYPCAEFGAFGVVNDVVRPGILARKREDAVAEFVALGGVYAKTGPSRLLRVILCAPVFEPIHESMVPDDETARRLLLGCSEAQAAACFNPATTDAKFRFIVNLLSVLDRQIGHALVTCPMAVACGCAVVDAGLSTSRGLFTSQFLYILYRLFLCVVMAQQVAVETYGAGLVCIFAWLLIPVDAGSVATVSDGSVVPPYCFLAPVATGVGVARRFDAEFISTQRVVVDDSLFGRFRMGMSAMPNIERAIMAVFRCKRRGVLSFVRAALLAMGNREGCQQDFTLKHVPALFREFVALLSTSVGTAGGARTIGTAA